MFDVFYTGPKPNLFAFEQPAENLADAAAKSRTKYFWFINGYSDYSKFDFDFRPPPWQSQYVHVWPSQWQPCGGTYFASVENYASSQYHFQSQIVLRVSVEGQWEIPNNIDHDSFDWTWHPSPADPPYIYHFPSQHQSASGVFYTVQGATDIKLADDQIVKTMPCLDLWHVPDYIDTASFDFSWHPNALDPPYQYEFATQWHNEGGPVYLADCGYETKYLDIPTSRCLPERENWIVLHPIYEDRFDWSWRPHPKDPPFIYVFGNQHWPAEKMPTVEYHVQGATERKYIDIIATLASNGENWSVPDTIDPNSIDFSWCPDPGDSPYIYEFATQWQPNGGARYIVPDATEIKYLELQHRRLTEKDANWSVLETIEKFDWSWHPNNLDEPYIYVFGNQHYDGTIMPTVTYTVPGATQQKFIDSPRACLAASRDNWEILEPIDEESWDWTWRPNPLDPPYIYVFGNQWNPPEYKASVRYAVPGATEVKYMSDAKTRRLPDTSKFAFNLPVSDFDYSWEPNPFDPPYIYAFGNQWNPATIEPTVIYSVEGATEIKYIDELVATVPQSPSDFELLDNIESFDYSWRPNPYDPPYIYVFGNQWLAPEQRPALRYVAAGATEIKYMTEPRAQRCGEPDKFVTHAVCDFDYSWEPDPGSPPYNYVFGNQWWPAEIMPTVEYPMAGATETKYMDTPRAQLQPTTDLWHRVTDLPLEFDYSWCPDPGDPPYIYVFGNQWYPSIEMPTVEYRVPGATEIKYMETPTAKMLPQMDRWVVPEEVDAHTIDFSWVPHPKDQPYIHHFGTEYQHSVGLTYTVPGAKEIKFAGEIPLKHTENAKSLQVLDIFFVDKSNVSSAARYRRLQERYPHVQKVRYVNTMMDTITRCLARSKTTKFWVISSECVYDDFDFAWHAQPWQSYMTHVFGSQWQKWSDTFLINKYEFERCAKWCNSLEEFPNLNFVNDQAVIIPNDLYDIYWVDHGNEQLFNFDTLQAKYPKIKKTRLAGTYLDTLKRIANTATTEYVWIISSLCDYTRFDFSWQPEPWQREMIHVFPSGTQRRGDTFYIHVESFTQQMVELELLDWFNVINYCEDQVVERWPFEVVEYHDDDLVAAVRDHNFSSSYTLFVPFYVPSVPFIFDPCLWSEKDRKVISATKGNAIVFVPRDAKSYVQTQLYDYPYIEKLDYEHPINCDVIFISNGEPDAERWYQHLCDILGYSPTRIQGVNGRVAAYKAAAKASRTNWFFAVFAKLEVDRNFDWTWQPDRMQELKHYIFHARNPVNGLEYGHMGMIAYNKKLVLETEEHGLDFTLSKPHAVVPLCSGVAHYNTTPELTWRTAFREVVKLSYDVYTTGSIENNHRLKVWLSQAQGEHAEWSIQGAKDARQYCEQVKYAYDELLKTFEWEWLRQHWLSLHSV